MSDKPTLPVGVSVLLTDVAGRVLLGERINTSAAGLLSTPGGRIEPAEDMFECAMREFQEETGAELSRDHLRSIGFREHFRYGGHYFMNYIHATRYEGEIQNMEPEKCKGWEWVDLAAILQEQTTEPLDILRALAIYKRKPKGKLVRDKVRFIKGANEQNTFRSVGFEHEMRELLIDKLNEEVAEFNAQPCLEELADVQEVVYAIKDHFGYDPVEFERQMILKSEEKGRFTKLTVMEPK